MLPPRQLRDEVAYFKLAPKPWERIITHKSLPELRTSMSGDSATLRRRVCSST